MTLALLLTAVGGAWAQDPNAVTAAEINSDLYSGWTSLDEKLIKASELPGFQAVTENQAKSWTGVPSTGAVKLFYEFVADGKVKVVRFENGVYDSSYEENELRCYDVYEDIAYNYTKYFYTTGPAPAAGPTVTINDDKTEASFEMPTSDVTVNYELVRDMSVQMQAKVGDDAAKEPRYRVQWNGERWVPADLNLQQVLALFSLKDLIEDKTLNLTSFNDSIYAVDAEGNPIGDAMDFTNFTFAPGRYCVTVTAPQGIAYEGTTAPSNIFELYQGYEVTVPAGEYISYYQSEALYVEDEDAVLYTIANVTATEAQLSDAIKVAPAETPLLVYNKSEQDKTFLLIPTTDKTPDNVTAATQFVGTLEATTIPASATGADNYALNGKAFVWVKNAIEVGANKCWLQIGDQPAAARAMTRSIVGGGNTTNMDDVRWQMEDGNYYDLQGRKVEKPNRKGIYIHNGKKVIVR